jgi:serine protease Do
LYHGGAPLRCNTLPDCSNDCTHADKGLKAGDVILHVTGETVSQPGDVAKGVKKAMDKAKDKDKINVLMQVKIGDQTRFVALSLKEAKA